MLGNVVAPDGCITEHTILCGWMNLNPNALPDEMRIFTFFIKTNRACSMMSVGCGWFDHRAMSMLCGSMAFNDRF